MTRRGQIVTGAIACLLGGAALIAVLWGVVRVLADMQSLVIVAGGLFALVACVVAAIEFTRPAADPAAAYSAHDEEAAVAGKRRAP